jgi:hypothetical protein
MFRNRETVYFGLTSHTKYAGYYGLKDVIAKAKEKGYKRLKDDSIITAKAIAYGYHHYSNSSYDIHEFLFKDHYTLCLEKKSSLPSEMLDTASDASSDIISALSLSEKDVATPPSTAVTKGTSSTKSAASLSAGALEMSAKGVTPSQLPALPESLSSTNSTTNEMNAALNA